MDWQPIASAPRDKTHIWVILGEGARQCQIIGHLVGRSFEVWHEGETDSGYDLGWSLFPGYGGCPDYFFAGWMPLPKPPVS